MKLTKASKKKFSQERLLSIQKLPLPIQELIKFRNKAREAKDWKKSDELRDEILKLGFKIIDPQGKDGMKIMKVNQ